jgi:hypothetical protein
MIHTPQQRRMDPKKRNISTIILVSQPKCVFASLHVWREGNKTQTHIDDRRRTGCVLDAVSSGGLWSHAATWLAKQYGHVIRTGMDRTSSQSLISNILPRYSPDRPRSAYFSSETESIPMIYMVSSIDTSGQEETKRHPSMLTSRDGHADSEKLTGKNTTRRTTRCPASYPCPKKPPDHCPHLL